MGGGGGVTRERVENEREERGVRVSERGRDGWMDGWMDGASERARERGAGEGADGRSKQGVHSIPAHKRLSPERGAAPAPDAHCAEPAALSADRFVRWRARVCWRDRQARARTQDRFRAVRTTVADTLSGSTKASACTHRNSICLGWCFVVKFDQICLGWCYVVALAMATKISFSTDGGAPRFLSHSEMDICRRLVPIRVGPARRKGS